MMMFQLINRINDLLTLIRQRGVSRRFKKRANMGVWGKIDCKSDQFTITQSFIGSLKKDCSNALKHFCLAPD